jgi:hypothetical protein
VQQLGSGEEVRGIKNEKSGAARSRLPARETLFGERNKMKQ